MSVCGRASGPNPILERDTAFIWVTRETYLGCRMSQYTLSSHRLPIGRSRSTAHQQANLATFGTMNVSWTNLTGLGRNAHVYWFPAEGFAASLATFVFRASKAAGT